MIEMADAVAVLTSTYEGTPFAVVIDPDDIEEWNSSTPEASTGEMPTLNIKFKVGAKCPRFEKIEKGE
jgi:hypothetical protein